MSAEKKTGLAMKHTVLRGISELRAAVREPGGAWWWSNSTHQCITHCLGPGMQRQLPPSDPSSLAALTCSVWGGAPTPLLLLLHSTLLWPSCSCSSPAGLSSSFTGRPLGAATVVDHSTCNAHQRQPPRLVQVELLTEPPENAACLPSQHVFGNCQRLWTWPRTQARTGRPVPPPV